MTMSVLVVDDSAVSRRMLIRSLPPGWDVAITEAANGIEALAALGEKHHAVVVLDLNMPVMDGYKFLAALRGSALDWPIVIVLSGDIQPLAQARVKALGARAFIKKPVGAQCIRDALQECGVL
jgi:two-component system, chemotaxis family, chemotaxis protein CheY